MKQKILIYCISLTIGTVFCSCSKQTDGSDICIGKTTDSADTVIFKKHGIARSTAGFILYDPVFKKTVTAHNAARRFIPASTMKVLTVLAALELLGHDYTFETAISYTGKIKNGTLHGDLYLKGGGDPLLKVIDLFQMAKRLKKAGIRKIEGKLYFDDSFFTNRVRIDDAMEEDASYNPGYSALSLEYNFVYAHWDLTKKIPWRQLRKYNKKLKKKKTIDTELFKVHLTPSLPMNSAEIIGRQIKEDIHFYYRYVDRKESWLLFPTKFRKGRETLPVKDPGLYTAQVFAKLCKIQGIEVPTPERGMVRDNASVIVTHASPPLIAITEIVLTYSNNLMAELLMLSAARKITGKAHTLEQAAGILASFYKNKMPHVQWDGLRLKNGSGLTSETFITPEQMTSVLIYGARQTYDHRDFMSLLPVSGWKWSLVSRLNGPDTAFHVWAKTGTINYAIGLAGYLYTKSGRKLVFTFFITDINKRRAYETSPRRRTKKEQRKVSRWYRKNREFMDEVITGWIQKY